MSRQDPAFLPNWGTSKKIRFVIVGLGGTGGYLFYYLTRLLASLDDLPEQKNQYQLLIADGDLVEEKNLIRQNFVEDDIGKSKARVLSERYGNVYGMSIPYFRDYIEDIDTLNDLLYGNKMGFAPRITVLVGAVDNNKTRQLFHQAFDGQKDLVYIDSGNDEWSGQVIMGAKGEGSLILPPVGHFYPDILEDDDTLFPTESCEEDAVSSPQNISTNITAATIIFNMINQLLQDGTGIYGATFNAQYSNVKSMWLQDMPHKEMPHTKRTLPYPFSFC